MKKSAEIRQELSGLVSSQQAMADLLKTENRSAFNESEQKKWDDLQKEIEERKKSLKAAEEYEENQRSFGIQPNATSVKDDNGEGEGNGQAPARRFSIHRAIRSQIGGTNILEGVELDVHTRTSEMAKRAGIAVQGICIPLFDTRSVQTETRADGQTVTQDAGGYGANLVPTEIQPVIDALRPKPVVEKLGAVFLTGLQGNLKFPVNNGGIQAFWEGEVDTVDSSKNAYGSKEMKPNRLSCEVLISLQNLQQSSNDLENYTMNDIASIVANAIDLAAINGSGSGQPLGILNVSGTNSVAGGANGAAPTFANMVALETGVFVENANNAKLNYVSNAKVRGKLKTTEIATGYPSFVMSTDGSVNGYPFETSNHVPSNLTKGTSTGVCSAAVFGDFSQVVVGQWGFMDITVDNISRKKDGYIAIIVNVFVDVLVKQPKAFSVIKDLLTA
ncbi:phage major capsid protein [Flavobacterium anhuiense]|uniref:phage major capsid protein n=1 Tax=Flavobacterium anhuiense TaxID=459526 RepID=UPI000E6BA76D|nr:phage major capsid protein [Flavobacterium anhuiense]